MKKIFRFLFYFYVSFCYHPKATIRLLLSLIKNMLIHIVDIKEIYHLTYFTLSGCYAILKMSRKEILLSLK